MYESDNTRERAIEQAKKRVIEERIRAFKIAWAKEHEDKYEDLAKAYLHAPNPPDPEPKAWFIREWGTGCVVMDFEKTFKGDKNAYNYR